MKNKVVLAAALLALWGLAGCSSSDQAVEAEKPSKVEAKIDQINQQNAQKIEQHITTPLDKARATGDLGDQRTEAMDQAVQQQ